jgi:hypothetical protein
MFTYLKFPFVVALWMITLMSGILSIAREAYGIYSGTIPARSVFWSSVWIAFALSATISWIIEHKKFRDEKNKNEVAPDIEVRVSKVIQKGKLGEKRRGLFVHVALTLKEPQEVLVKSYVIALVRDGTQVLGTTIDDVGDWEVMREHVDTGYERIPCGPLPKKLSQRGDPVDGWIHCQVDLLESEVLNSVLWVKVNGNHGTCVGEIDGAVAFPDVKNKGIMVKRDFLKLPS